MKIEKRYFLGPPLFSRLKAQYHATSLISMFLAILFASLSINFGLSVDLDASDIAKRIASRAKNAIEESSWGYYKNFGTWNYEGAMVIRGLWEIQSALFHQPDFDIEPFLHDLLDFYQVDCCIMVSHSPLASVF